MASKPSKVPRWAATAPGTITGTIAEPSEDKKTIGFVTREKPPSQFLDWLFYIIYTWLQYLSDGALVGDHSIDGSLTVGGQSLAFTDFTFTADNTTDTLTATAHPLETGSGPVRTSNGGGGLPGGLAAATDYYAIKTGANTFQLATSRSKALEGIAINITSNGTGTQTLQHQAGTTRAENLSVVGTLDATRLLPLVNATYMADASQWAISANPGNGAFEAPSAIDQIRFSSGTDGRIVHGLRVPAGTVLTKIRFIYDLGAAGNSVTLQVGSQRTDGSAFTEENMVIDTTSTTRVAVDVTNLGVDASGNFDQSDGSHETSGDRWYWIAMSFSRASGTIIAHGAVINPP